ncbi:PspA/IM30 family protein [Paenibacillus sp. J22TS3]|uniref:PspA/IM30 family protein n=1 Tax=Paenibacillus sp. J22TS3 TaxID=2807192 RepID=UPI001B277005|nr:PspA/IM30 family protein [Paenibacillus sp. J22TS3]GIP23469.1 membrane protein [Paenibacillus sp. J22TS3]
MSIFERLANMTKAVAHEALNKLENPVLLMNQYLRNLEEDIRIAERRLNEQQGAVKVLAWRKEEALRSAEQSAQAAEQALAGGNEAAAREAIAAKLQFMQQAELHTAQHQEASVRIQELEFQIQSAKEEYERLKEKRAELAARAQKAEERAGNIRPSFSYGLESGTAARGFERMEEKITQWEASLDASGRTYPASSSPFGTSSPAVNSSAVEEELRRLQSKKSQA